MWGFRGFCLGSRLFLGPWGLFFLGGGKKDGGRGRARGTTGGEEGKDGRGGERKEKPPAILGIAGGFCCLWG